MAPSGLNPIICLYKSPLPPLRLLLGSPMLVDPHPSQQHAVGQLVCTVRPVGIRCISRYTCAIAGSLHMHIVLVVLFNRQVNSNWFLFSDS